MRKIFFVSSLFLLAGHYCVFAYHPGEVGGQALKLATDSRPIGQGEAFCAVANDASAIYWNPAGLAQLERPEVSLTHMNRLIDIRYFNLSYAQPLKKYGALGFGLFGLYASDTRRDETTGNTLGKFMDYNTNLSLVYAYQLVFDISGLYALVHNIHLGLNLQNIPAGKRFSGELETVPFNVKTGIAYIPDSKKYTLAADVNFPNDAQPSVHLGGEYWIAGIMAVRAGYKYKTQKVDLGDLYGLSAGWGLKINRYRFDYAFTPYGDLGNKAHRVTLAVGF
ncbi:MAG: UPF0164 family protein [Elusimicrobia bacterium]|nr:UPF0164 family protein [Elusimicrobiota bacterium]